MNRTQQFPGQTGAIAARGLKKFFAATLVGAAICAMPAAQADVVDFEGLDVNIVGHMDSFEQAGVILTGYSNASTAQPGDFVGMVVDGTDLGVCAGLACPTNNPGHYYAALNDSILFIDPSSAATFQIKSFDASFIGAVAGASYPSTAGLLKIQGFLADNSFVTESYALAGPGANGFTFQHFVASTGFANQNFVEVAIFGYTCNTAGACTAFNSNQGQYALDNVTVAVPEPTSYLMMLLGLAGIAAFARRRSV